MYKVKNGLITLALFEERERELIKLLGMFGLGLNRGDGMA